MKFNFVSTFATLSLATLVSGTTLAAGPNWPFPEDPNKQPEVYPVQDVGTCKIITDGLVVLPGNSKDVKNTVQFGSTAKLTSQIVQPDWVLTVVLEGTNTYGKPVTNTLPLKLGVSIGRDYSAYSYYATDAADELRSFTAELEITERTKDDVATKALLSTLAKSNAINSRTGAAYVRTDSARYLCDLKPQP